MNSNRWKSKHTDKLMFSHFFPPYFIVEKQATTNHTLHFSNISLKKPFVKAKRQKELHEKGSLLGMDLAAEKAITRQ